MASKEADIAVIKTKIVSLEKSVEGIEGTLKDYYVNQDQFLPVKWLVFGFAGAILTTVIGAVLCLVITNATPPQITVQPPVHVERHE